MSELTQAPDGTYLGGSEWVVAPDGTYVGGRDWTIAPNGTYVGGSNWTQAPDGTYVGGSAWILALEELMSVQIERRAFEQNPYLPPNATWREIWVVSFLSLMFEVDALKFGGRNVINAKLD